MEYNIRMMEKEEAILLQDFLYLAIFVPEFSPPPSREIIKEPLLKQYIENFGSLEGDYCIFAELENYEVIGAVWVRKIKGYGHISPDIPELTISVKKNYRGRGIGRKLLRTMLELLEKEEYRNLSLSVHRSNPAVQFYLSEGFEIFEDREEDLLFIYFFY
ncbi:MAG: GNAT family N-acetyltransferase [Enterococcus lemanii]|jgi:ribosomal-protein-alanine N-acetyltransferase